MRHHRKSSSATEWSPNRFLLQAVCLPLLGEPPYTSPHLRTEQLSFGPILSNVIKPAVLVVIVPETINSEWRIKMGGTVFTQAAYLSGGSLNSIKVAKPKWDFA